MSESPNIQLRKNLRTLLAQNRLTQAELARRTKISPKTIHGWCVYDRGIVSIKQLKCVADLFGISVDRLCFSDVIAVQNNMISTDFLQGSFELTLKRIAKI